MIYRYIEICILIFISYIHIYAYTVHINMHIYVYTLHKYCSLKVTVNVFYSTGIEPISGEVRVK